MSTKQSATKPAATPDVVDRIGNALHVHDLVVIARLNEYGDEPEIVICAIRNIRSVGTRQVLALARDRNDLVGLDREDPSNVVKVMGPTLPPNTMGHSLLAMMELDAYLEDQATPVPRRGDV